MKSNFRRCWLGLVCATTVGLQAGEIRFGGHTWTVRSGHGGPGPNAWEARNVWVDAGTNLHLRIGCRAGEWSCAEVTMRERLGFGRYAFQVSGGIDRLDDNVVLGLFNYPTGDVGPDATHEIDIEFARWGEVGNPMGNFTVWPAVPGLKPASHSFQFRLAGDTSAHEFTWGRREVAFHSRPVPDRGGPAESTRWVYAPAEPSNRISTRPMPVHINLWLFRGRPPKDGREVEVVVRNFAFTPE